MSGDMFIWDYEDEETEEIDPREHWLEFPETQFLETQLKRWEAASPKRLKKWGREVAQGSEEAREKLIMSMLRSAAWIAQYYSEWSGHNREDLTQEAMLELTRRTLSKSKFTPGYYNWARYALSAGILRALSNAGLIRIPVHIQEKLWKIHEYIEQKTKLHGDESTDVFLEHIANRYLEQRAAPRIRSIMQIYDFDQNPQAEEIPDPDESQELYETPVEESELIPKLLAYLNPRQRTVIQRRIFEEKTLEQIAKEISVTPERIRQIEEEALEKLRKIATKKKIMYPEEPQPTNGLYAPQTEIRVEDLPPLEKRAFKLRYFQERTKEQIAKELSLTPEQVELTTRRAEKRIICGPRYIPK